MKKLLLLSTLALICCKKESTPNLAYKNAENYLSQQTPDKIDSLQQIRLDTITEKTEMLFFVRSVGNQMDVWHKKNQEFIRHADKYSILEDEVAKMKDSIKLYSDKSIAISKYADKVIEKHRTADSTKILGYYGLYKVFSKSENGSRIDSAEVIFNKDFSVRDKENYRSELWSKYGK